MKLAVTPSSVTSLGVLLLLSPQLSLQSVSCLTCFPYVDESSLHRSSTTASSRHSSALVLTRPSSGLGQNDVQFQSLPWVSTVFRIKGAVYVLRFLHVIPASFPAPVSHIISPSYLKSYALGNDLVSRSKPVCHSPAWSGSLLLAVLLEESTHSISSDPLAAQTLHGCWLRWWEPTTHSALAKGTRRIQLFL